MLLDQLNKSIELRTPVPDCEADLDVMSLNCPPIAAPTCSGGPDATCTNSFLTCDNVPGGGDPRCSVIPGVGSIPGENLCNATGTINKCPSCTISTNGAVTLTCAAGNLVCTNYHSSSTIIPAPRCTTTAAPAAVDDVPQIGMTQCIGLAPSCKPLAAPQCDGTTASCAIGLLTCNGQDTGDGPVCSLVGNPTPLSGVNGCTNNQITLTC